MSSEQTEMNLDSNQQAFRQADAFNKRMKAEKENKKKKKGITAFHLKVIAMVSLVFFAVTRVILYRHMDFLSLDTKDSEAVSAFMEKFGGTLTVTMILEFLGCIAFPILAYLLVMGYVNSQKKAKDIIEFAIIAIVSEIPYDLAMSGKVLEITGQNMYLSLFLGLCAVAIVDLLWEKYLTSLFSKYLVAIVVTITFMFLGILSRGFLGIAPLVMMCMYIFKQNKLSSVMLGIFSMYFIYQLDTVPYFLSLIPIALYNGEQGKKTGYMLHVFYPLHLIIIYVIAVVMKLY